MPIADAASRSPRVLDDRQSWCRHGGTNSANTGLWRPVRSGGRHPLTPVGLLKFVAGPRIAFFITKTNSNSTNSKKKSSTGSNIVCVSGPSVVSSHTRKRHLARLQLCPPETSFFLFFVRPTRQPLINMQRDNVVKLSGDRCLFRTSTARNLNP